MVINLIWWQVFMLRLCVVVPCCSQCLRAWGCCMLVWRWLRLPENVGSRDINYSFLMIVIINKQAYVCPNIPWLMYMFVYSTEHFEALKLHFRPHQWTNFGIYASILLFVLCGSVTLFMCDGVITAKCAYRRLPGIWTIY